MCPENDDQYTAVCGQPTIYKEGLTERVIILCKLNKSLLERSKSVGIIGKKVCIPLRTFVFNKPVGPIKCEFFFCLLCDF